jgi:hypothetical protein
MRPAAAAVKAQDELATLGLDCGLAGQEQKPVRAKGKNGLVLKAAITSGNYVYTKSKTLPDFLFSYTSSLSALTI